MVVMLKLVDLKMFFVCFTDVCLNDCDGWIRDSSEVGCRDLYTRWIKAV